MNTRIKWLRNVMLLSIAVLFNACNEDDAGTIPVTVNFTNTDLGVSESVEVGITFSRAAETAGSISIGVVSTTLIYGQDADFYTNPAMNNGEIELTYAVGDESLSLTVFAGSGLNIDQDEQITLIIQDSEGVLDAGTNVSATVAFSENFIAPSGTLEIDGGGANFPNQAFIDLSKVGQTIVDKYSWDLGFSSVAGSHQVIVNNSAYVMARPLTATDIDAVTAADTAGFAAIMYLSNYSDTEASGWIDNHNGDLAETAFGTISATDSENTVFIIKRDGEGRNWKKVRVLQNGDNYTLQYADINATTHTSVTISKDDAYNFNFFDLDNGAATVEPEIGSWDIMYSTYANRANFGVLLAVGFNDFVTINREGVSAVMVSTDDHAFDDFGADDISSITFEEDNISVIGSSWRSLVDFSLVLNEDRFYVIKDSDDNVYKLKFTRLKSLAGERGYPEISFEKIQ